MRGAKTLHVRCSRIHAIGTTTSTEANDVKLQCQSEIMYTAIAKLFQIVRTRSDGEIIKENISSEGLKYLGSRKIDARQYEWNEGNHYCWL